MTIVCIKTLRVLKMSLVNVAAYNKECETTAGSLLLNCIFLIGTLQAKIKFVCTVLLFVLLCTTTSFIQALGRTSRVALKIHLSATFMTFSKQLI